MKKKSQSKRSKRSELETSLRQQNYYMVRRATDKSELGLPIPVPKYKYGSAKDKESAYQHLVSLCKVRRLEVADKPIFFDSVSQKKPLRKRKSPSTSRTKEKNHNVEQLSRCKRAKHQASHHKKKPIDLTKVKAVPVSSISSYSQSSVPPIVNQPYYYKPQTFSKLLNNQRQSSPILGDKYCAKDVKGKSRASDKNGVPILEEKFWLTEFNSDPFHLPEPVDTLGSVTSERTIYGRQSSSGSSQATHGSRSGGMGHIGNLNDPDQLRRVYQDTPELHRTISGSSPLDSLDHVNDPYRPSLLTGFSDYQGLPLFLDDDTVDILTHLKDCLLPISFRRPSKFR